MNHAVNRTHPWMTCQDHTLHASVPFASNLAGFGYTIASKRSMASLELRRLPGKITCLDLSLCFCVLASGRDTLGAKCTESSRCTSRTLFYGYSDQLEVRQIYNSYLPPYSPLQVHAYHNPSTLRGLCIRYDGRHIANLAHKATKASITSTVSSRQCWPFTSFLRYGKEGPQWRNNKPRPP